MIGDTLRSKKGDTYLDMYGEELLVGQPVIMMNRSFNSGGRGSFCTGVIVGCLKGSALVLKDDDDILEQRAVVGYAEFFHGKTKTLCGNDYDEIKRLDLDVFGYPESVTTKFLIGCTEHVRRGVRDGSIFKE